MIKQYPSDLLEKLSEMQIRETYVRLELLDWQENFLQQVEGIVTTGSISINGKSSMRRTCNFTFILPENEEEYVLQRIINLNKKFKLFCGYKNYLSDYQSYGDILWFKMGTYVFTNCNFSHSSTGTTLSVTAQDKMCLLNGTIAGSLPESIILHNRAEADGSLTPVLISQIIYELVNHYGRESSSNIFINNVPQYGRALVKYMGTKPLYLLKTNGEYNGGYSFVQPTDGIEYEIKIKEDLIGYKKVDFIYPGELISSVGESVSSILDKICTTFGNFEYFYDIDGHFIFQEKLNYLNASYPAYVKDLTEDDYRNYMKTNYIDYSFIFKLITFLFCFISIVSVYFTDASNLNNSINKEYYFSNSEFFWPTPGYHTITSYFGKRNAPTSGASTYHSGIDIAAPSRLQFNCYNKW